MKFHGIEEHEDGSIDFRVSTRKSEVLFLVDYAVKDLINKGFISLEGIQNQEVKLREVTH